MKTYKATSFATPQDLRGYIKCRDNGGSINHCFSYGDNGEGCFGDDTWNRNGPTMVALPATDMIEKWGSKAEARGKKVRVTLKGSSDSFIAECRDQSPDGVIDFNPASLQAAGLEFDAELSTTADWEWID
jgi:hypothetical protein